MLKVYALAIGACGATRPAPEPPVAPVTVDWKVARAKLGFELASIRDAPIAQHRWEVGGVITQRAQIDDTTSVHLMVRTGTGESLAGFRSDHEHDWKTTTGPAITVCGQPAIPIIATHAEEILTCVMTATGNHPGYIAPRRAVAVQFVHRGLPVVASFEVEAPQPASWNHAAAHFFDSLRCK
jgi:hypothetical protein